MKSEEKGSLARRLVELNPQPLSPRVSPEDAPDELRNVLELLQERRKKVLVDTYMEQLSREELEGIVCFYESDLGRSLTKVWAILDDRMRREFPSLAREAAKEAGLSDVDMANVLASSVTNRK